MEGEQLKLLWDQCSPKRNKKLTFNKKKIPGKARDDGNNFVITTYSRNLF